MNEYEKLAKLVRYAILVSLFLTALPIIIGITVFVLAVILLVVLMIKQKING